MRQNQLPASSRVCHITRSLARFLTRYLSQVTADGCPPERVGHTHEDRFSGSRHTDADGKMTRWVPAAIALQRLQT